MEAPASVNHPPFGGIYIHIPFCERKCPYCDFYSVTDRSLQRAFLDALCEEIRRFGDAPFPIDTLYIGGGTPSLLDAGDIAAMVESLNKTFSFTPDPEVTLEVNPGTVDRNKLRAYRRAGVNRLSIGVQSFQDPLLGALGRIHTAAAAEAAVASAHAAGYENIGLDLMFGIPGQTRASWQMDLDRAASCGPDHLSCYMLTYESRTPLARAVGSGKITPMADARTAVLMETAMRFLADRGYVQYEISNYATSLEKVSRHNSKYWSFAPYLGLGPSAHTFLPPLRRWNHRDIRRYLADIGAGRLPLAGQEILTRPQRMIEAIYLELRTHAGIDVRRFDAMFRVEFKRMFQDAVRLLSAEEMILLSEDRCRLTRKGILFHESVVKRLIDGIDFNN